MFEPMGWLVLFLQKHVGNDTDRPEIAFAGVAFAIFALHDNFWSHVGESSDPFFGPFTVGLKLLGRTKINELNGPRLMLL